MDSQNRLLKGLIVSIVFLAASSGFPGGMDGIGGGGILARLLVQSQTYSLQTIDKLTELHSFNDDPEMKKLFFANRVKIKDIIGRIDFAAVKGEVKDQHTHAQTWIRVIGENKETRRITVEYNPDIENYLKLIDANRTFPRKGATAKKPYFIDVLAFFMHEVGHRLMLSEEVAWKFAFAMAKELKKHQIQAQHCYFHFEMRDADSKTGKTIVKDKIHIQSFQLRGIEKFVRRSSGGTSFHLENLFGIDGTPRLSMTLSNTNGNLESGDGILYFGYFASDEQPEFDLESKFLSINLDCTLDTRYQTL